MRTTPPTDAPSGLECSTPFSARHVVPGGPVIGRECERAAQRERPLHERRGGEARELRCELRVVVGQRSLHEGDLSPRRLGKPDPRSQHAGNVVQEIQTPARSPSVNASAQLSVWASIHVVGLVVGIARSTSWREPTACLNLRKLACRLPASSQGWMMTKPPSQMVGKSSVYGVSFVRM